MEDIDNKSRSIITSKINENFLVEASAGSGKTTMLVDRLVAMVESGINIEDIVTITFTKKAANEFYERFYQLLSDRINGKFDAKKHPNLPLPTAQMIEKDKVALQNIDLCFMGTIDSFCNSVLNEHPFEANIPSSSVVIENNDDILPDIDLALDKIRNGADKDLKEDLRIFESLHYKSLRYDLIIHTLEQREYEYVYNSFTSNEYKTYFDKFTTLFNSYRSALAFIANVPHEMVNKGKANYSNHTYIKNNIDRINDIDLKDLKEITRLKRKKLSVPIKKAFGFSNIPSSIASWFIAPEGRVTTIKFNPDKVDELFDNVFGYFVYVKTLDFLTKIRPILVNDLRATGKLKFIDNIIYLNNILKDPKTGEHVHKSVLNKHKFYLIDEFQDTSPLQCELFFRLAADKYYPDWEKVSLRKGALFMVGDPKQSIYHFRGADFASYSKVKNLLVNNKLGEVLSLTRNFRTNKSLCTYFNDLFNANGYLKDIPNVQSKCEAIPLDNKTDEGSFFGNYIYDFQAAGDEEYVYEAKMIKHLIDTYHFSPKDFMVITYGKGKVSNIKNELEKIGIPTFAEGMTSFDSSLINNVLALFTYIVNPNKLNEFALITRGMFTNDFEKLDISKNIKDLLTNLPKKEDYTLASALLEDVINLPFVLEHAGSDTLINLIALVNTLKNKEITGEINSFNDAVKCLYDAVKSKDIERVASLRNEADVVRVANLHKVKGLEAKVIVLAGPASRPKSPSWHDDANNHQETVFTLTGGDFNAPIIKNTSSSLEPLVNQESTYLEEERKRLMYVAATRAGQALLINNNEKTAWKDLVVKKAKEFKLGSFTANPFKSIKVSEVIPSSNVIDQTLHQETYSYKLPSENTKESKKQVKEEIYSGNQDSLLLGTIVHKLMELIVKNKDKQLSDDVCERIANDYDASKYLDLLKQVKSTIYQGGYKQVSDINDDIYKLVKDYECHTEVPFTYLKDGILTYGVIDLLLVKGDKAIIIDYKTDKDITTDHTEQLKAYQAALKTTAGLDSEAYIYNIR